MQLPACITPLLTNLPQLPIAPRKSSRPSQSSTSEGSSPPTSSYTVTLPGPCRLLLRLQFTSASLKHFPTGPPGPILFSSPFPPPWSFLVPPELRSGLWVSPSSILTPRTPPLALLSIPPTRPDTCLYMSGPASYPQPHSGIQPSARHLHVHPSRHLPFCPARMVQDPLPKTSFLWRCILHLFARIGVGGVGVVVECWVL